MSSAVSSSFSSQSLIVERVEKKTAASLLFKKSIAELATTIANHIFKEIFDLFQKQAVNPYLQFPDKDHKMTRSYTFYRQNLKKVKWLKKYSGELANTEPFKTMFDSMDQKNIDKTYYKKTLFTICRLTEKKLDDAFSEQIYQMKDTQLKFLNQTIHKDNGQSSYKLHCSIWIEVPEKETK